MADRFEPRIVSTLDYSHKGDPIPEYSQVQFVCGKHYISIEPSDDGLSLIVHAGGSGHPQALLVRASATNSLRIKLENL